MSLKNIPNETIKIFSFKGEDDHENLEIRILEVSKLKKNTHCVIN